MNKNRFLTFFFACLPGAGQMYLGYMKRGFSIMLIFSILLASSSILYITPWFIPVIWFTAFFDALNIGTKLRLGEVQNDSYIYINENDLSELLQIQKNKWNGKVPKYIGISVICIGIYSLLNQFYNQIIWYIRDYFNENVYRMIANFWHGIPRFVVSVIIIIIGLRLLKTPKKYVTDNLLEYQTPEQEE